MHRPWKPLTAIWAAPSEKVSWNIHKMHNTQDSSRACAKSHPDIRSPLLHSIVSIDTVSGQWKPWSDCADAHSEQGLSCPHMPEDTFSHGAKRKSTDRLHKVQALSFSFMFYFFTLCMDFSDLSKVKMLCSCYGKFESRHARMCHSAVSLRYMCVNSPFPPQI